jgi:hypothetical protein
LWANHEEVCLPIFFRDIWHLYLWAKPRRSQFLPFLPCRIITFQLFRRFPNFVFQWGNITSLFFMSKNISISFCLTFLRNLLKLSHQIVECQVVSVCSASKSCTVVGIATACQASPLFLPKAARQCYGPAPRFQCWWTLVGTYTMRLKPLAVWNSHVSRACHMIHTEDSIAKHPLVDNSLYWKKNKVCWQSLAAFKQA